MTNTVKLIFAYKDSDSTRSYSLDVAEADIPGVKDKILAINQNKVEELSPFVDNAGNPFERVKEASIIEYEETYLPIDGGESNGN